jgi:hypothetical protein
MAFRILLLLTSAFLLLSITCTAAVSLIPRCDPSLHSHHFVDSRHRHAASPLARRSRRCGTSLTRPMKLVLRRRYLGYFYQVPRRSVAQSLLHSFNDDVAGKEKP